MHENILKAYENAKKDIDRWFSSAVRDQIPENKRNDTIECIYCIGKAVMLSSILERDFREDIKEERKHMKQIKDFLQFDVLRKLEVG